MPGNAIEWLLKPWTTGAGFGLRSGRVLALVAALTAVVLPYMIVYYGIDDWWWDTTVFVCLMIPIGVILFDQLGELVLIRGLPRLLLICVGLIAGVIAGYTLALALDTLPGRTSTQLWADCRRTLGIVAPIAVFGSLLGASTWYRGEAFRSQSALATARFNVLQAQMQPHVLFNALNTLKELITESPARAIDFTQGLADLYRLILQASRQATSPLEQEIAIVRHYLAIEQVRFGERLRFTIDADAKLLGLHVPALMLQTLAENAVKHGVNKSRAGGEVNVRARSVEGGLELEVSNTGAPFVEEAKASSTGLANTRARLALMYGPGAKLTISAEPSATSVRFVVSGAPREAQ